MNNAFGGRKGDGGVYIIICLALIGIVGSVLYFRRSGEVPSQLTKEMIYTDFVSAHKTMNDLFTRAQRDRISDPQFIIRGLDDLNRYSDLRFVDGDIVRGIYTIRLDFKADDSDDSRLLPPLIAAPIHPEISGSNNNLFPVLLFRPEDNPPNAMLSKLRLNFLTGAQIYSIFSGNDTYDTIKSQYQFITIHQKNYWPYFNQKTLANYFEPVDEK